MSVIRVIHLLLIVLCLFGCSKNVSTDGTGSAPTSMARLESTRCWFNSNFNLPKHQCYFLHVTENKHQANRSDVALPIVRFSSTGDNKANPVIHLGGGGPGAGLLLESEASVFGLYEEMKQLSVAQGRDLYLIDPRGSGLAKPSLTCPEFTDTVLDRWKQNLTLEESYRLGHQSISQCIDRLTIDGVDFASYNSFAVAADIEQLRVALKVDQWVLFGVSYASVYAQTIAKHYPTTVESMVLDSATFPDIDPHDTFVNQTMAPYRFLYNYCDHAPNCDNPIAGTEQRFWAIKEQLDKTPITLVLPHPVTFQETHIQLNGWRFVDTALWAAYDERVFIDLPNIIVELEHGKSATIKPYVEQLLGFLTDTSFGDISSESHYCFESKPLIDTDKFKRLIGTLPNRHIQKIAQLGVKYMDHCDEMGLSNQSVESLQTVVTDIPTLFIHGSLDSTTLLSDVLARRINFPNSSLITAPESHNVHDNACVNKRTAEYVRSADKPVFTMSCKQSER